MSLPLKIQDPERKQFVHGSYVAEVYVDTKFDPVMYHYVVTAKGQREIVCWGEEVTMEEAELAAMLSMKQIDESGVSNPGKAGPITIQSETKTKKTPKQILLIDLDDARRDTRVRMLQTAGYEVRVRNNYLTSEELDHEGHFDLMILALHRRHLKEAAAYTDRIRTKKPTLPLLLLTDASVFAPKGSLSQTFETGDPKALMIEIAEMLAGSSHIRELDIGDTTASRPSF